MRSLAAIRQVALGLFGGLLLSTATMGESLVTGGSKAAGLDSCVAPTALMRRNHMDYLKHDRDETVLKGIRDTQYSLSGCVDCHAEKAVSGGYKPVNSEGQFCASCHRYVAVSLTCFQCHSKTPQPEASGSTAKSTNGLLHALGLVSGVRVFGPKTVVNTAQGD